MLKLDAEMKRTDSLLYQMIPKPVADRLRRGEPAISTCEVSFVKPLKGQQKTAYENIVCLRRSTFRIYTVRLKAPKVQK